MQQFVATFEIEIELHLISAKSYCNFNHPKVSSGGKSHSNIHLKIRAARRRIVTLIKNEFINAQRRRKNTK